jgi:serine/threonine protein phosphatase PrpC
MGFEVDVGLCSERGTRSVNEDHAAVRAPAAGDDESRGLIAAIADGVSAGGLGREAAQTSVLALVDDYHAVPDTWDTTVVLDRLLTAQNTWLADHNRRRQAQKGGLTAHTTLTALVLRGHAFTLAHVGDTRAWLLRDGEFAQLTTDHCIAHPDFSAQLTRALGLDEQVHVDYLQAELHAGDVFVLASDGVHGVLAAARIAVLAQAANADAAARAIVAEALAAGSRDNASALVLRVQRLADMQLGDLLHRGRMLPVPPKLAVGARLDGWVIDALVADDGVHRLYRAHDGLDPARRVAIKTLHTARADDPQEREMLAHEAWLAERAAGAAGFVAPVPLADPAAFYFAYDWHDGQTLEARLAAGRPDSVADAVGGAIAITRALGRLHRLGIVHRDIKPGNLHLGSDGEWRILDLGVAVSGREPRVLRTLRAGTPSYMNPEQWPSADDEAGRPADAASDVYAFGVTLYEWLTGRLPYGRIEPYQRARFRRDPKPPSRLRPEVPIWLDHVVGKAVALQAQTRFETAEELLLALERGAARPLAAPRATPLAVRDPAGLWKIALGISILLNLLLIYWLLFLPR